MSAPTTILAWWLAFLLGHFVLSHPPVRSPLVKRLGEQGFRGLYSLVAVATFVPLVTVWWSNRHVGPELWRFHGPVAVHSAEALALIGFALMGAGALTAAPSSFVGDYVSQPNRYEPKGIIHVTRHPVNMGVALWALSHMGVNGWTGDVLFFGGFAVLGLLGSFHQDWRFSRERPAYGALVLKTSFLPRLTPRALRHLDGRSILGLALGGGGALVLRTMHDALFR